MVNFRDDVAFVGAIFVGVLRGDCDAEGLGVEGGLGDEPVGCRDAEEAGDACGSAEKEDVPVEAGWFSEGELGALRNQ